MDGSFYFIPRTNPQASFGGYGALNKATPGPLCRASGAEYRLYTAPQQHRIHAALYPPTDDWASELTIQWFTANSELLATGVFRPDAVDYYCARKVENYSRVSITFAATNRPGRYLKLTGIDYGVNLTFEGQEVVKANVLEEVDLLSNEVRINTLGLTLHNKDGLFSILNPGGVFSVLQHKQKVYRF